MGKDLIKRLDFLESIAQEKQRQREEQHKSLYIRIVDNTAIIRHDKKRIIQAASPFDAVATAEDYLLQAKPEKVTISACLTGFIDLMPGAEEHEEFREADTYFTVPSSSATGNYYRLLEAYEDVTLVNIFLCELMFPYLRRTISAEEMGIEYFCEDTALGMANNPALLMACWLDRARKTKAYAATHEPRPYLISSRLTINQNEPSNTYSRYWPDESTRSVCTHERCYL